MTPPDHSSAEFRRARKLRVRGKSRRTAASTLALYALCSVASGAVCLPPTHAHGQGSAAIANGLSLVNRYYLFYDEVETAEILEKALERIENRLGPVHAEALGGRSFMVSAGRCRLRVEAPPSADIRTLLEPLKAVVDFLESCVGKFPDELPPADLLVLDGVLSALDPYSTVLEGKRQTEHSIQFTGKLAGIGARIGVRDGNLSLVEVYEGSPAHKAGLRDNDTVMRVDGLSTTNIQVGDAVQRIRGPEGTPVVLTIERSGEKEPRDVTVTRGVVTIPSVTTKLIGGDIIYAEISHYSQTTPQDFRTRVGKLVAEHPVKGVVIDVRTNSGGSMLGSAAIADQFLSSGTLITTAGREGRSVSGLSSQIKATYDTPFETIPVAVLTARRTASGSELMAASLRNHDRAILVGDRSFGKGTVQKTFRIGNGAVAKLTVGHFLPNEKPIPGGGMIPDIEVVAVRANADTAWIPDHQPNDLPYWLRRPAWSEDIARHPIVRITGFEVLPEREKADQAHPESAASLEAEPHDLALEVAARILRRFPSTSASRMLDFARVILSESVDQADTELSQALQKYGLDWERGPRAAGETALKLELDGPGGMRAGEEATVRLQVTNLGTQPVYRLRARIESEAGLVNQRALLIGKIAPGETGSAHIRVTPSARTHTGRLEAKLQLFDDHGHIEEQGPFFLAVDGTEPAHVRFRKQVTDTDDPGVVSVNVEIGNPGNVAAENLTVTLEPDLEGEYELLDGTSTIDRIEPGEAEKVSFRVQLLRTFEKPRTTKLSIVSAYSEVFLENAVALVTGDSGFGRWLEPPRVAFETIEPGADTGEFAIRARVTDETGLREIHARIGGNQVERAVSGQDHRRELALLLPWQPSLGVKRYEITATDSDGLKAYYTAGM